MSNSPVAPKPPAAFVDDSPRTSDASVTDPLHSPRQPPKKRKWTIILSIIAVAIVVILALTLGLYFGLNKKNNSNNSDDSSGDGSNSDSNNSPSDDSRNDTHTITQDDLVVDLGYSKYQGHYLQNDIREFLGIRYAQAPTGDLRWRAPVAPKSTEGTQSADKIGPVCPGVWETLGTGIDEDCLFVNIWAPVVSSDTKLPVMVYFQPGGYIKNTASRVNATELVQTSDNNIIFVNFGYRVGLFGFLASNEVKEDGDLNAGLLDQRFLLKWVQEHISKFGGDPDHVILHGESAGAGAVALHLAAYSGRDEGLFAGAISESTFMPGQPKVDDLEYQFERVVNATDCYEEDDRMACLRSKSSEELQSQNGKAPFDGRTYRAYFYWAPCTDGDMFPDYPSNLYEKGDFVKVPTLIGACTNGKTSEGSGYAVNAGSSAQFIRFMQNEYPYLTEEDTETILDLYPREPKLPKHDIWFPSASRAYGEVTFVCPVNNVLNAIASHSDDDAKLWSYRYNVQIDEFVEQGRGVPHVANGPAVFGPNMVASSAKASYLTYNAPMIPIVMNYWISFVRALDPNKYRYEDTPRWETWGDDQRRLLFELGNVTMESVDKGERERCEAWLDMGDSTKQ
ncbi:lipase 2 [Fusarium albosuccineum]|uniref:Carboxylic ester hydrolase n=1 Tax=Fusarium albosuccineum TaxID=1237068 RepID=A0A8H4KZX3_9HYPO|nr:lipase 2 [Fusarium albosuccineum]